MELKYFVAADYVVLLLVLAVSSLIGVFFAWKDRRSKSNRDFLIGNRQLQVFPVTMSMMASFLSSISVLGTPAESYVHGSQYSLGFIGAIIAVVLAAECFLPVYYKMEVVSVNAYLEKRFKSTLIRKVACVMFMIHTCFYMGVVLYGPSLALGSVTGLPVWASILVNGLVCTFYTTLGGIKAVVWTDVVQMTLMAVGFLMVLIKSLTAVGGVSTMWKIAGDYGRLEFFDMSFDFQKTFTFWGVLIGSTTIWSATYCVSQTQIQRYCSLPSFRHSRKALYINMIGVSIILFVSCFCGLALFAIYYDCDPVKAKVITKYDQIMPLFVMENLHHLPGFSGLFVSAVYSGSLSTLSSGYNALAAVTWEDFLQSRLNLKPRSVMWLTKIIAASYGALSMALAFLAGTLPSILEATFATGGSFCGGVAGLFFLGFLFPWCGSKTGLSSMALGTIVTFWVAVGSIIYKKPEIIPPSTTDGCYWNVTAPVVHEEVVTGGILNLYHISYMWLPPLSFCLTLITGIISTLIMGLKNADKVDPELVSPVVRGVYRRFLEKHGLLEEVPEKEKMMVELETTDDASKLEKGCKNGLISPEECVTLPNPSCAGEAKNSEEECVT